MRILFVHQNMPGQFGRLASSLAADPANQVAFITRRADRELPNVMRVTYELTTPSPNRFSRLGDRLALRSLFGDAAVQACEALLTRGFQPDVVVGHPGWGELLFLKDRLPGTPMLSYCEFYHSVNAPFFAGDPPASLALRERMMRRADSAHLLLSLEAADLGWSPTCWQKSLHPAPYQDKIRVIFDGVDAEIARPNPAATFELASGLALRQGDEVVTFAARALEPCRGFPTFMRALPEILRRRPNAQVVIAGGDAPHYDPPPALGLTWRESLQREVKLDLSRVHFAGRLPHNRFIRLLQVSALHVHLTTPTTLSWSLVEAMSVGCLILASETPPVSEVLRDGENGFLTPFNDSVALARQANRLLEHKGRSRVRQAARHTVLQRLSAQACLPRQVDLVRSMLLGD